MAEFWVKSGRRQGVWNDAENMPFSISIRAQIGASSENGGLSMILPKFRGYPGQPICLQNGPFR